MISRWFGEELGDRHDCLIAAILSSRKGFAADSAARSKRK
jgi:hypothetical protein